ncbi:MAG: sialidase family protein, partial [Limisphaerales bacterium]
MVLAIWLASCLYSPGAGLQKVDVFRSGTEGYNTFRIPAIVRATNGTLLAFAEGRKNSASDTGDIDLVLKLSRDGGRNWGPLQLVAEDGVNTVGNPTPIMDSATGKILLLTTHNVGRVTETQVRRGEVKDRRVFLQQSTDNGATWSVAREVTAQTKRADWRCYATGPVHGIQLERGPQAGRLVAPCDHTTARSTDWSACGAHLIY